MVKNAVVKYQIWFQDKWPLGMPSENKEMMLRYGMRLARAYGKGYIMVRVLR